MSQIGVVIRETYRRQVKAWSFLILVISPFVFILISFGVGYVSSNTGQNNNQVAVVTTDASLRHELQNSKTVTAKYGTTTRAKQAVKNDKIKGYLKIEQSKNKIAAVYHGTKHLTQNEKRSFLEVIGQKQQEINVQSADLSQAQAKALGMQPQFEQVVKTDNNDNQETIKTASFMLLLFIMYFILITYTSATAQEIAAEKGTKIMEMIFSSMTAQKYFYGKIGGIFCVIATQILIYILGGSILYSLAPRFEFSKQIFNDNKTFIDKIIANLGSLNLIYVIAGVVLFTVLAALCGALVVRPEDATKATQPALYIVMVGFFGALMLGQNPTNIIVEVLSFVPFLSSFFMPIRIIDGSAGTVQVIISLLILLASTFGLTFYVGKIYSGLILQTDDIGLLKSFRRGISIK
ncbi:ABC transporter, permease [Liquorilactobacillus aquaticus DSM 21051]|uniref:ABC transporter, permease n=1 Tax=Liquorilactobacillus aquaticus DSM 21051 TaxID=1423725 RepID=A0A0R2D5Y0_9LACO|nr:ABC transporter permease [Liquorilactobacillus aquaticus]KRM97380.1 ABC transporter, permease [Liquorilactobacillus aquaticus DSM 21051]